MSDRSATASAPVAIEVREVRKSFPVQAERLTTLKERLVKPSAWLRQEAEKLEALREISFDVNRGEFFGVIGRNGCGKSTLLKLLASIYSLDGGSIRVAGRLAPFIELGVGFNHELTARDNVLLNGVMMGLSPAEARARYDVVIDFAELHEYTNLKLKNYSSGMQVRLAFALMMQADADILLVDEVLAVGDVAFQEKCIDSLERMKRSGGTIVLVTHDMGAIQSHCDRAMMIEHGEVEAIGDPAVVSARYLQLVFAPEEEMEAAPLDTGPERGAEFTAAWLTDGEEARVEAVSAGEPVTVNLTVRAHGDIPRLQALLELVNNPEGVVIARFPIGYGGEIPPISAGEELTMRVSLDASGLRPGSYRFHYHLGTADRLYDRSSEPLALRITGADPGESLVDLSHRIEIEGGPPEGDEG